MAPIDLNLLRAFAAVHVTGSFTLAAAKLGVPRSTVSRAVYALEEVLGTLLFQRTTRTVKTTADGVALHQRIASSLATLESSVLELPTHEEEPAGTLRITTLADIANVVLADVITRYTLRYPRTRVEVDLGSGIVNLAAENFDLAVRVSRGPLKTASLIAQKVGALVLQLYASPAYVARKGMPRTPRDLGKHEGVTFRDATTLSVTRGGTLAGVAPSRIVSDDIFFLREVMRGGGGIGLLPTFLAEEDVAAGRLVRVLPKVSSFTGSVYLVHPSRRHVPRKVTAFREIFLETLRQRPLPS